MSLLTTRRFLPLFITQFLGAFNDNVFKNALVMMITFKLAPSLGGSAQMLVTLAGAVFILPYFLLSATAGQVADKFDRARVARAAKAWEIFVVAVAACGFYLHNAYFLLFVLFCLGVQATFFGPVKYALLPQHLRDDELITGNAYIEAGMFMAILLGTIAGGVIILRPEGEHWIAASMVAVALGGYIASRFIPPAPAPSPGLSVSKDIARATWRIIQHDRKNPRVFKSIVAISWFWLVGATFLAQFPNYTKDILHGDETVVTLLLTLFSVGIGAGSLLCNLLLKGQVKATFVPYAALGLSLFAADLFFAYPGGVSEGALQNAWQFMAQPAHWRVMFDLFAFTVCGGLYIVPLYAIMQHDSDPNFRARTIATNNVLNALFMVASAIITLAMLAAGFSVLHVFLATAIANLPVAVWLLRFR